MRAQTTPTTTAAPVLPKQVLPDDLIGSVESQMAALVGTGRGQAARAGLYHLGTGGRRVRARLALHAGLALRLAPDDAVALATAAELLHNASLIHDDLQDRDRTRRDAPTVWQAFGDDAAICSGDLLLSSAYAALASVGAKDLIALCHARVAEAIDGQSADRVAGVRTIGQYELVASQKSGALLSLPLEAALIAAGRAESASAARDAAGHFAIGYQIADDLGDIGHDEARGALNVVLVLRASHGQAAEDVARALAMRHLAAAVSGAAKLPDGCGTLLGTLAMRLSATL